MLPLKLSKTISNVNLNHYKSPSYELTSEQKINSVEKFSIKVSDTLLSDDTEFYQIRNIFILKDEQYAKKKLKLPPPSDPTIMELELTPRAKLYTKALLSPFAVFPYILQYASKAFDKSVFYAITFLVCNLLSGFSFSSYGMYQVRLPIFGFGIIGSIIGINGIIRAFKKVLLSIPEGIHACYLNVIYPNCSVLEFICGKDKQKKNFFKRIFSPKSKQKSKH